MKDTIHVDVLRLPDGIHRLIRMKGLPYWYKAFEDSFTSVIRSACSYQKNPIDLNGLRRELSRHSPTEFDYDSALTTLCLDLSALCQYEISLEAHPLLIYGEKGNAASALLSLLALLRDYCQDPTQCPAIAKELVVYLSLRFVPKNIEELLNEAAKMVPMAFGGLQRVLDDVGSLRRQNIDIQLLFAYGIGGNPYRMLAIPTGSDFAKWCLSVFCHCFDEEFSRPLHKITCLMQPGQVAAPCALVDENDEPIGIASNDQARTAFVNVAATAQADRGKASDEFVRTFPAGLRSRFVNRNIVQLTASKAIHVGGFEMFLQSSLRSMGITSYHKFQTGPTDDQSLVVFGSQGEADDAGDNIPPIVGGDGEDISQLTGDDAPGTKKQQGNHKGETPPKVCLRYSAGVLKRI